MNISANGPLTLSSPLLKQPLQVRFGNDSLQDPLVSQVTTLDRLNPPTSSAPLETFVSQRELDNCYRAGFLKPVAIAALLSTFGALALGLLNLQNRAILKVEKNRTQTMASNNEMLRQALEEMSEPLPPQQQIPPHGPRFRIAP